MTDSTTRTPSGGDLITASELAVLLRVSKTSIYRLVERRLLPFHRLRKGLRFSRADVDAYLASCRVEPVSLQYERTKIAQKLVG